MASRSNAPWKWTGRPAAIRRSERRSRSRALRRRDAARRRQPAGARRRRAADERPSPRRGCRRSRCAAGARPRHRCGLERLDAVGGHLELRGGQTETAKLEGERLRRRHEALDVRDHLVAPIGEPAFDPRRVDQRRTAGRGRAHRSVEHRRRVPPGESCAGDRRRRDRPRPHPRRRGHLRRLRRLREAARAAIGIDLVTDVLLGAMHALAARGAHRGVVVQGRNAGDPARRRQPRQVEREIEEAVQVHDVGTQRVEQVADHGAERRRRGRFVEIGELPVVDDLGDADAVMAPPDPPCRGRSVGSYSAQRTCGVCPAAASAPHSCATCTSDPARWRGRKSWTAWRIFIAESCSRSQRAARSAERAGRAPRPLAPARDRGRGGCR